MTDYENIKNCWSKIKAEKGQDALVENFYQTLFKRFPETQKLFPEDIETQKRTLLATIDNIINGIEYVESIKSEILDLGQHHKNLGVTNEMFETFIITIVDAADFASNSSLTKEERTAWENGFRKITNIMLEAF